ncbi:MAG: GNAT family N-acetyltransferase [Ignavibacteria bacterium]|nr:GNAT family N-acetyltransferase [Ignavibacteria bacterium]
MMNIEPVTLKGERVTLIPLKIEHLDGLFDAIIHEDVWAYRLEKITTKEGLQKFMQTALDGEKGREIYAFTIIDNDTGKIIGTTRFADISPENHFLEIGWTSISPEVMRSKVNTECKYLLLKHCFDTLGTVRVCFKTLSINKRSQNAILRIGAKHEGTLRWIGKTSGGEYVDVVYFSIIKPEWNDVKLHLENLLLKKY